MFTIPLSSLSSIISYSENEILKSLLAFEALPLLKKINQDRTNFVLKVAPLNVLGSSDLGIEVQFIHVPLLQKVIEENISLFKYILGPTITSKKLVDRLAFSEETLSDILLENPVLIGIVLGYGPHNSLIGGRKEYINFLSFSRDLAPFASKGLILNDSKESYGWHYLNVAGGNDQLMSFKIDDTPLVPMPGFLTLTEEIETLNQLNESLPHCLNQTPSFHFGAYKGGSSNQSLFERLTIGQKNIQKLLKKEDFLENLLIKLLGQQPYISCEKTSSSPLDFSFFKGTLGVNGWKHLLLHIS